MMWAEASSRLLHGSGFAATQNDIEAIAERVFGNGVLPIEGRYQARAGFLVRDAIEDGVERKQRISGKIHLRDQAREQPRAKKRKVNVRGTPGVGMIPPGVLP